MPSRLLHGLCAACILSFPSFAAGQSAINPDISAIADMRYNYRDAVARSLAGQKALAFEFEELELNISGYLNPYVRADVFLSVHEIEGPFELEEIYATVLRGLPAQLRFGKYFLDIGKLNTEHPHQWAWMERPHMHRSFFGDEGAQVIGLGASRMEGIGDTPVTLSLSAFRSDFFSEPGQGHAHGDEEDAASEPVAIGYSGRLSVFRELTASNFLEAGVSYLRAEPDAEHDLLTQVANADVKYKWLPDTRKGASLRAEVMYSHRDLEADSTGTVTTEEAFGVFSALEVRFLRRWDAGAYFDYAQSPVHADEEARAGGVWLGFMPMEESARFSLVYRLEELEPFAGTSQTFTFQVLWSLGPHKPHPF